MTSRDLPNPFDTLSSTDSGTAVALLSAVCDLVLIVDEGGVIRSVSHNLDPQSAESLAHWSERSLAEVVRRSSRPVVSEVLGAARRGAILPRFSVQHRLEGGLTLPVQYAAARTAEDKRIILVGRDLRPVTELQSRLLANQRSLDAKSTSLRKAEAHYRLLFESASDAMLTIDAATGRIREANPRAAVLLGLPETELAGGRLSAFFRRSERRQVNALLKSVLASGNVIAGEADATSGPRIALSAELFRAGDLRLILVRLSPARGTGADAALASLVRSAAEAVLLTDEAGRILWANDAFLALSGLEGPGLAAGRPVQDFFGWSPLQKEVLLQSVRRQGRIEHFAAAVRSGRDQTVAVDVSAVSILHGTPPGYGFVMRSISAASALRTPSEERLERAAEGLIDMIGRVPLKDLVRETTDVIERMCIETALRLSGNNRTLAARALGLSRQALYAKLGRYGIAAPDADDGASEDGARRREG